MRKHRVLYSTYLGGNLLDEAFGITLDTAGNVYITGRTASTNFPVTTGAYDTSWNGGVDAFVTKLNPAGTGLVYSTYLGGSAADVSEAITLDKFGNIIITGDTMSADFPITSDAYDTSYNGDWDIIISQINPSGASLIYSTFFGGTGYDMVANSVFVNSYGYVYLTGLTNSWDFPITPYALDTIVNGSYDGFVSVLSTPEPTIVESAYWSLYDQMESESAEKQ